ncbi:MAG: hypothetical protein KJ574_04725 [Nanoarchaeota archaeon]|nr:hypothetical protein [Nanoarchaeota archaeon]
MSFLSLHKRISKDKKAGISTAPTTIIGLIVAVIVILGTFVVFAALLGMFTGSADQQTELFYDNFVHGVIALEDSSIPIGGACWVSGSLHEDWALIMFDAAGSGAYDQCGSDDWVNKPNGCGGNRPTELGCVCICYGGV